MQEVAIPYIANYASDVIERDDQTVEQDRGDLVIPYPYDPTKNDIDIQERTMPIYQFMRLYDQQRLIIDPEFQRNVFWKIESKSSFIESILLSFPLPSFFVNQQIDGRYVIIDGLQRTTTLHQFVNGEFQLTGLNVLKNINGKNFKDLPSSYQARIEDKKILLFILKPSVPIEVIYELFARINTSGTVLNRQEIRNGVLQGQATRLLRELSKQPYFRQSIDNGVSDTRMKDRELILRYLSFKVLDYSIFYQGDMSAFLDEATKKINSMTLKEIECLKIDFERVMKMTYEFFGEKGFRIPQLGRSRGLINSAMFESICYFFSSQTDDFLTKNKERIINNFRILLDNSTYIDSIRSSTGHKAKVFNRFGLVQDILGNMQ